jgi:glyoxylase I family protein
MTDLHILGTDHTGISVTDIDRSIAFYRDILGFQVTEKVRCQGELFEMITGVPGAVIDIAYVEVPGHRIELLCYLKPDDRTRSGLRPCDGGSMHLAFKVKGIDRVIEAIRAAGFEAVNPIQTVGEGPRKGLRAIYARDPDGVVLEFMEYPE